MSSLSWKYIRVAKMYVFLLFIGKVLKAETYALDILDNVSVKLQYLHVYVMHHGISVLIMLVFKFMPQGIANSG